MAEKDQILADLKYFVGRYENNLIWNLKLTNNSNEAKEIDLFVFVEFGMMEYLREVTWGYYML